MKTIKKYIQLPIFILLVSASSFLSAETVTYYINDVTGSPIAAMEQSGSVIWRESYNPYGEGRIKPSQNTDDVGFTGHQKDDFTGLTYMQARYYDPIVGRFYGVDPVGFSNVHNFNRYAYANNNPFKYVDPDGQNAKVIEYSYKGGYLVGRVTIAPLINHAIAAATSGTVLTLGGLIYNAVNNESSDDSDSFDTDNPDNSNPLEGEPDSCSECNNSKGKKKQRRHYGQDGLPDKDEDYDHAHGKGKNNSGSPHVHDWDRPSDGSPPTNENRGPARKPEPNEIKK